MQAYQERVVTELKELNDKRDKLRIFLGNGVFVGLPIDEQNRLTRQYSVMTEYADVLSERIANFK